MRARLAAPAALVILATVATAPRFANDFVFDDEHVIVTGEVIHDPSRLPEVWTRHTMFASDADQGGAQAVDTYRPVPITLFVLDAAIGGREPVVYHATNLLLHLGCVLLVYLLALAWLGPGARLAAFYGAAVFAVHPWASEAHVWINGRSDPLCALFGLGAMLLWLGAERGRGRWRWPVGGLLLLLGLLSKEVLLLAAPAIALMPSPHGAPAPLRERLKRRTPRLAAAAAAYLGARALVLGGLSTHRDGAMIAEAAQRLPWLLVDSLYRALVPGLPYLRSLRDEYAALAGWQVALAGAALVGLAALAFRYRRRRPLAAWSLLWFALPLLPVAILTTVLWPGFGRYLYLPVAGLGWALADLVHAVWPRLDPGRRRLLLGALLLHLGALCVGAASFALDFRSSEALYAAAIRARPDVAMGHGWLGLSRYRHDRAGAAVAPLSRAAELDPETHRYLIAEGRARLVSGDREGAAFVAAEGIARFRGRPEEGSYHLLAVNSMSERDPRRALRHLARCLEVWPDHPGCAEGMRFLLQEDPAAAANRAILGEILARRPEWRELSIPAAP